MKDLKSLLESGKDCDTIVDEMTSSDGIGSKVDRMNVDDDLEEAGDKNWADYSDIAIFALGNKKSKTYSAHELEVFGKDIVDKKFKGNIGKAYDAYVTNKSLKEGNYKAGQIYKRGIERLKIGKKMGKGYQVTIWGPKTPSKTSVLTPKEFGDVTLLTERNLRDDIPSDIDSFLQDVSQQTEIISYGDILNKFQPNPRNLKELKKLELSSKKSIDSSGEIDIDLLKSIRKIIISK